MMKEILERLRVHCETMPVLLLKKLSSQRLSVLPGKWSKQEILGHLCDSCTVNTHRLVRARAENLPVIWYEQDKWVSLQHYRDYEPEALIRLWESLNRHYLFVASRLTEEEMDRQSVGQDGSAMPIRFLVADYLEHLEHHLDQLLDD